jgi:2-polyprenyl-3-methyl-5-hydroxy-6-metoxy-1,4-benzoquinol methylase
MVLLRKPLFQENSISIFCRQPLHENEDYNASGLDILHKAENKHFWFLSRKERLLSVFEKYVDPNANILEIGAGTGNVSESLMKAGYNNISVGEMHINGLRYAEQYGIKKCYQFDLFDPPFKNHFDVIGMFDVLEHLDDDQLALHQCRSVLKTRGGQIALTVPAFNFLWSRDDDCGHKRRYTIRSLKQVVEKAGFDVLHCRYFFCAIMPLLILRHFIQPSDINQTTHINYVKQNKDDNEIKINPLINRLLLGICRMENKMETFIPNIPGGSIILVARKREY